MNTINPYTQIQNIQPKTDLKDIQHKPPTQTKELSREEIISSKDLSPEEKLKMLGIKPMSVDELSTHLADVI